MGCDYHLFCVDCKDWSEPVEYSIVGYLQVKYPDEVQHNFIDWTKFLIKHSGHKIKFQDFAFNETNPENIEPLYVLTGLKEFYQK